jgi:hypothetical protein
VIKSCSVLFDLMWLLFNATSLTFEKFGMDDVSGTQFRGSSEGRAVKICLDRDCVGLRKSDADEAT